MNLVERLSFSNKSFSYSDINKIFFFRFVVDNLPGIYYIIFYITQKITICDIINEKTMFSTYLVILYFVVVFVLFLMLNEMIKQ